MISWNSEAAHLFVLLVLVSTVSAVYWTHPEAKDVFLMVVGGALGILAPKRDETKETKP